MATNNTQTNSRRTPTRPRETSPAEDVTPPPHPPLQHDDPQRVRDYAHAIDFENDTFSAGDMFANSTPLPRLETPNIISAAEQPQRQQARNHPPARGAGLDKTESRPLKRVRFDTPQPGRQGSRGDALKGNLEGEGERAQKRVRFDMPQADEEEGGVEMMSESSGGESVRPQGPSKEETQQAEKPGDEGNSSDDCAWSLDSEVGGGGDGEKAQGVDASSDQDSNVARDLEQPVVEAAESSDQS